MTRTRTLLALLFCAVLLASPGTAIAQDPGGAPQPADPVEESVLRQALAALGWRGDVTTTRLMQSKPDEDTFFMLWPPGSGLRFLFRTKTGAENGDPTGRRTMQYARILSLGEQGGDFYIDKMVQNGYTLGTYQGRQAAIMRAGDRVCETRGLMEVVRKAVNQAMSRLFFGIDTSDDCLTSDTGTIAWSCGSHIFVARDNTGQGAEEQIAAALYAAAEDQDLCAVGDTLVILAQTSEQAGTKDIFQFQLMAEAVSAYFQKNAYGKVSFAYTFLDQDGAAGADDWFTIGGVQADYVGREGAYAIDAVQAAFQDRALAKPLEFDRVIVIHPGFAKQRIAGQGISGPLVTLTSLPGPAPWHEIAVGPQGAQNTIRAKALILVAENDTLGPWAHEMAHSVPARYQVNGRDYVIDDRYNSQLPFSQNGNVSAWDLMCWGAWWGLPPGAEPVHLSAFSKESAGWLTYSEAVLGEKKVLTALEKGALNSALRIDDPTSADPEDYILLEARQSGGTFGAPESGVVAYLVSWDGQNKHHVVNNFASDIEPTMGTSAASAIGYERPTLHDVGAANAATEFEITPWRMRVTLHSEGTDADYWAEVSTSVYTPTGLVGATINPAPGPAPATDGTLRLNDVGPLPDIDLHAWDDQGRHVGPNYSTGEYERQIPGTEASGDLRGEVEWIYVPEGTQVRYAVSAEKTRQFLEANPEWATVAEPQEYAISYSRFDAQGAQTVADGGEGVVPPGIESPLSSPDDPSLKWRPAPAWHYGRNWPTNPLLWGFTAGILLLGAIGGIVALARR
jgi:M6 family metalloprotease-like protein